MCLVTSPNDGHHCNHHHYHRRHHHHHHNHHHHNRILLYEETSLVTSPNDGHRGHTTTIPLHEHQKPTQCLQIQKHKYKYTSSSSSPCYSHLTTMDADETGRTSSPFRGIRVFSSMIACKRNIFIFIKKKSPNLKKWGHLVIMAPSVHLAIGVSPLLGQLVPRLRLRQQLRHRALAQTQNVPGDERR